MDKLSVYTFSSALRAGRGPQPGDRQVPLKTLWLSLDPYMRGRMSAAHSLISNLERHWNAHQRVA